MTDLPDREDCPADEGFRAMRVVSTRTAQTVVCVACDQRTYWLGDVHAGGAFMPHSRVKPV